MSGVLVSKKTRRQLAEENRAKAGCGPSDKSVNQLAAEEGCRRAHVLCDRLMSGELELSANVAVELYGDLRDICKNRGGFRLDIRHAKQPFDVTGDLSDIGVVESLKHLLSEGKPFYMTVTDYRHHLLAYGLELYKRAQVKEGLLDPS